MSALKVSNILLNISTNCSITIHLKSTHISQPLHNKHTYIYIYFIFYPTNVLYSPLHIHGKSALCSKLASQHLGSDQ